jgi:hypothetical protein
MWVAETLSLERGKDLAQDGDPQHRRRRRGIVFSVSVFEVGMGAGSSSVFILMVLGAVDLLELGEVGGFRWRSRVAADGVGF